MSHEDVLKRLRQEIKKQNKPENQSNYQRFHKEKLKDPIGLKVPVLRNISKTCFKEIKDQPASDILDLCDYLLASGERYMRFFGFEWALNVEKHFRPADFKRLETWLKTYVVNWGNCDHLCCGAIGKFILRHPDIAPKVFKWTRSKNRWERRAAAVSLIVPVRKRLLLDEVFKTADAMLLDDDDMVQKGYGWMLKEATHEFPDEVFDYVMQHKERMPRTALRYAIEKLPPAKRREAMKK